VTILLDRLLQSGAHDQAAALTGRLPAAFWAEESSAGPDKISGCGSDWVASV
jgi:hypothetical protein